MEEQNTNLEKRMKILVADDEESNRKLLTAVLHEYDVKTVPDGKEALKELEKEDYPLLFTDMIMPGLNGEELIKEIRNKSDEKYKKLKIVVISGSHKAEDFQKYNIYGFLRKPFNISDVESYASNVYNSEK